jgi:hypothetical protein
MSDFLIDSPFEGLLDDASHDALTYREDAALDALDYSVDQEAIFNTLPPSESDDAICEPIPSAPAPQQFQSYDALEAYVRAETTAMGFAICLKTTKSYMETVAASSSQIGDGSAEEPPSTVLVRVNGYFYCQFHALAESALRARSGSGPRRARPDDAFCEVDEKGQPVRLCTWRIRWSRRGGVYGLLNPRQLWDEPHSGHTMRRAEDTRTLQRLGEVPRPAYEELQKWIRLRLPKASLLKVHIRTSLTLSTTLR